jgi:phosphate transport system permease protein
VFEYVLLAFGLLVVALVLTISFELWHGSAEARHTFGLHFLRSRAWDPVNEKFGAGPYIFGTLITSVVSVAIATPIGIGAAVFLVELAPRWLRQPVGFLVEMLAAIPSVIYGLWALVVLVPFVREHVEPTLNDHLGFMGLFQGPKYGVGYLSASLVLTIMILPTITSISQAVLLAVPWNQREAAYGIGATRWEVISAIIVPYARNGIIGAVILGLGRALGETMAVTMVIGNRPQISWSLFATGDTMASVIANQFVEASYSLYSSVLIEIGLVLFAVTVLLNLCARLLVMRLSKSPGGARA